MVLVRWTVLALVGFLALAAGQQKQQTKKAEFFLKDNDTVVFYGDSITDQRLYTVAAEAFVVTRFPKLHVRFVHSGWGGDRVTGGGGGDIDTRLKRDVFSYKPTVMTIMLGMNDGRYRLFDEEIFNQYRTGYEKIVSSVKREAPGVRLTLIEPSPYDDVTRAPNFPDGYNSVLVRYGAYLRELAARTENAITADLNHGVVEMLHRAFASNPVQAKRIVPDRVHPGWAGHFIMAAELLKAWNAPKLVTNVEIDAAGKTVVASDRTAISGLRESDDSIVWTQKDEVLPMALPDADPATVLAVRSSDFMDRLNVQWLRVSGLAPRKSWSLVINGLAVAQLTSADLAAGLNLSKFDNPMMRQSAQVLQWTVKRAAVHNLRWRQMQLPYEKDGLPRLASILDNLDALDEDLAARQRSAARPSSAYYELIPVTAAGPSAGSR